MKLTPRQELLNRRDNYLSRISIFDSFQTYPEFDYRPALVRRFLAGGDDRNPRAVPSNQPWPVNRPPLAEKEARDDAVYRLSIHDTDKSESNRSDDADYDKFIIGSGGMDLTRITGIATRAAELWQAGMALEPDHVFELRASEIPTPSDSKNAMSRAWTLLILAGYDENSPDGLNGMIDATLNAADWSIDKWYNDPANPDSENHFIQLKDRVDAELKRQLNAYFFEHPAWFPPQPPPPPPTTPANNGGKQQPPPKEPTEGLPPDVAAAIRLTEYTLRLAFGDKEGEAIVQDLRAIPLKEDLIVRLLVWLDRSTTKEILFITPERIELLPPEPSGAPPESAPSYDSGGLRYIMPQIDEAAAKRWESVKAVILLLRLLGQLNQTTVGEACLRLDCITRLKLNSDSNTLRKIIGKNIESWPDVDEDKFKDYKNWLNTILWARTRYDFAFLLILSITDNETFVRIWVFINAFSSDTPTRLFTVPDPILPIDAFYWRHVVKGSTFAHILAWKETADFKVADHIRFLGLVRPGGRLRPEKRDAKYERWLQGIVPGWFTELVKSSILGFKFWVTDQPTPRNDEEEMTFWSENHQALFASAEFIAGQWFPDAMFLATSQTGKWHRDRAAERLERWLHDRLRFGFAELNSPVYYEEHLQAILNTVDFVEDERLRRLGVMVLDLMVFDVARRNCQGSFIAASSRVYSNNKSSGWAVSIRDFVEILTGTIGDISSGDGGTAVYLSTSRYLDELPECLLMIASERKVPFVDRSRVSISFDDAEKYGVGFDSGSDMVFWWGHSAFFTDKTYRLSQSWSERWHLRESGPFKLFNYVDSFILRLLQRIIEGLQLLSLRAIFSVFAAVFPALGIFLYPRMIRFFFDFGSVFLDTISGLVSWAGKRFGLLDENDDRIRLAKTMIEQQVEEAAIELNAGSLNERIHFYMWRSADAMLSSLIDEKKGKTSAQKAVFIASLGMNVSVFVTKPAVIDKPKFLSVVKNVAESEAVGAVQNLELWKTIPGALDLGGDPAPDTTNLLYSVVVPLARDSVLSEGPSFWAGEASNPLVWQNENVSISIYSPHDRQRDISNFTHAYWPWDHFDETSFRTASQGQWIFGRRDRRPVPRTPLPPDPAARPTKEKSWPDTSRREESESEGSGYIALFSAGGIRTTPAENRNWGHKELICDGHNNIWITVVGDRATYGSFKGFVDDVLEAKIDANIDDGRCSITMPDPGSSVNKKHGDLFEVGWQGGGIGGLQTLAKLADKDLSTNDWPRFELKPSGLKEGAALSFGISNKAGGDKVDFDDTFWRIEYKMTQENDGKYERIVLFLEHDFTDMKNPRRDYNQLPEQAKTGVAKVNAPNGLAAAPKAAQSLLGAAFRGRKRFTP